MPRLLLLPLFLVLALTQQAQAQARPNNAPIAPNAPADRPVSIMSSEASSSLAEFDRHVAPAVKQARATLAQAKKRFLAGLPEGQAFFLTTRVKDPDGLVEQVFVRVTKWDGKQVAGAIANQLDVVKTYRMHQVITFPESAILDWTISRPDGSEEGNYVGKLIDADGQ